MTIIEGQLEPLKKLREILDDEGITRFASVGDINRFLAGFDEEKASIPLLAERQYLEQTEGMRTALMQRKEAYANLKKSVEAELRLSIQKIGSDIEDAGKASKKSFAHRIFFYLPLKHKRRKKRVLEKNSERLVRKQTVSAKKELIKLEKSFDFHVANKDL